MKLFALGAQVVAAGMLMAFTGLAAAQQAYPNKPIRFITPYPPGGTTTTLTRILAQKLTESWGQAVIVDNRGGGNTIIGTEALVKSPPDGYTILLITNAHVIIPNLLPTPYNAIKDFAPVATVGSTEVFLVLNPSVPANTVQELIALAKSKPGQLNYASAGSGSPIHLAGELFNIMAGVKMQHVPYKGSGPALTDLIGGQVQLSFQNPINVIPHIKSGKLKAIAITGEGRFPGMPQVPTMTEAGLPGFNVKTWFGVLAPAGTPRQIVDKLSSELARIVALPDTREKLISQGLDPFISTPEQFAALMKADLAQFATIIKTANIKLEQ